MFPIMNDCVDLLTEILKDKTGDGEGVDLDIYDYYQGLTLDVISRCALALQLDCQRNQQVSQKKFSLWKITYFCLKFN